MMTIDQFLKELFNCKKRTGAEGSVCETCGMNHTVTGEYLQVKLIKVILREKNKKVKE